MHGVFRCTYLFLDMLLLFFFVSTALVSSSSVGLSNDSSLRREERTSRRDSLRAQIFRRLVLTYLLTVQAASGTSSPREKTLHLDRLCTCHGRIKAKSGKMCLKQPDRAGEVCRQAGKGGDEVKSIFAMPFVPSVANHLLRQLRSSSSNRCCAYVDQ